MMKTIDISDASIAEVIRKQMAVATVDEKGLASPFFSDVNIPAGTFSDANDIYSGWYFFAEPIENIPITDSGFIYAHRLFNTSGISIQYCTGYPNGALYLRTGQIAISGSKLWGAWKKIYP